MLVQAQCQPMPAHLSKERVKKILPTEFDGQSIGACTTKKQRPSGFS